eukprot:s6_g49.t1
MEFQAPNPKELAIDNYLKGRFHRKRSKGDRNKAHLLTQKMKYYTRGSVYHLEHHDLWDKMGSEKRLHYMPSTMKVDECLIKRFNRTISESRKQKPLIFANW